MKQIYLGADHAGFHLKEQVKSWLHNRKIPSRDLGNLFYDLNDDYPDFAAVVGKAVVKNHTKGLLFCGSAEGICIAANKIPGIRAVAVWDVQMAKQSRLHNDANILCLSGGGTLKKVAGLGLSLDLAKKIIQVWLATPFSGASRHVRRIRKIALLEKHSK